MKSFKVTAALAAALALTAPMIASAAAARNVVLVHGAFAGPSSWDKVAKILRADGFTVSEVNLPMTSLQADVDATRKVLASQKGPTVLVGHSWGGVVIGESGNAPNVKALVYIAAFAPDKGESVQALSAGGPQTEGLKEVRPDANGFLSVNPDAFARVFVGDVPESEGKALAAQQMPIAASAFGTPATVAAWHDKPDYYAISADDKMIPPQAEALFAKRMNATTVTISSSHASPVSHPQDIARLIEQAAKK